MPYSMVKRLVKKSIKDRSILLPQQHPLLNRRRRRYAIFGPSRSRPAFRGGNGALQRFMGNNLRDPRDEDEELAKTVKVQVKFAVVKDGRADAFDVVSSGGEVFDKEVLRVLRKMPRWKPARQNNRQVAMFYTMPVSFAVNETE